MLLRPARASGAALDGPGLDGDSRERATRPERNQEVAGLGGGRLGAGDSLGASLCEDFQYIVQQHAGNLLCRKLAPCRPSGFETTSSLGLCTRAVLTRERRETRKKIVDVIHAVE